MPDWLRPSPFDGSADSLAEHADAIGAMTTHGARLWLGPFDPPPTLPEGFEDTVLVVPTSGSTGAAKAVAHGPGSLRASQDATADALGGHGFWLPLLPPTHIAGIQVLARAHRTAQVRGLTRAPLPDRMPDLASHFDANSFAPHAADALGRAADAQLPAFTSLVPTQLGRLIEDASADGARARALLGRFDAVLVGGAATAPDLLARARGTGIRIRTTYGSSETAGGCVYDGVPLPGVQLSLDRSERLLIGSPTLAHGYLAADGSGDPLPEPWATSDLARITDGELRILGRADDVINTGGRKVAPQDVERALARATMLRGVIRESLVVGVPDPEWGQRLEALVVLTAADATALEEIPALVRAALRTSGVPGHMIPRRVHVVERLPHLGIGKPDRRAATRIAADRGR